jgi:hypothetical protein
LGPQGASSSTTSNQLPQAQSHSGPRPPRGSDFGQSRPFHLSRRRQQQAANAENPAVPNPIPQAASPPSNRRRSRRTEDPGMQHLRRTAVNLVGGASPASTEAGASYLNSAIHASNEAAASASGTDQNDRHSQLLAEFDSQDLQQVLLRPELQNRMIWREADRQRRNAMAQEDLISPKGLDNKDDGRPEPKEGSELVANIECKVCMSQLIDTVVFPCGHAVLCRWCAEQHMPSSRFDKTKLRGHAACPMCRKPVSQKVLFRFCKGQPKD